MGNEPTGRERHPDFCPFTRKRCEGCEFELGDGCAFKDEADEGKFVSKEPPPHGSLLPWAASRIVTLEAALRKIADFDFDAGCDVDDMMRFAKDVLEAKDDVQE